MLNSFFQRLLAFIIIPLSQCIATLAKLAKIKRNRIWLIGENRGYLTKDNGYYFFRFCQKHKAKESIYIVVRKSCNDLDKKLKNNRRVLIYGSIRHFLLFGACDIGLYTHDYRDLMFRRIFQLFGKHKKLVYLHHGVLGLKRFDDFYMANKNIMEVFTIAFRHEENILRNIIQVDPKKLFRTGYARHDYLVDRSQGMQNQIVYIPTFRDWSLAGNDIGKFFKRIKSFLTNPALGSLLNRYNTILKLYMHVELANQYHHFNELPSQVHLANPLSDNVHDLLESSHLMISDYSSVSWDFVLLKKPVVFYRFDCDRYEKMRGAYIDLKKEIIGEVVREEHTLIHILEEYAQTGFKAKALFVDNLKNYLDIQQGGYCSRIYDQVSLLENKP